MEVLNNNNQIMINFNLRVYDFNYIDTSNNNQLSFDTQLQYEVPSTIEEN